MLGRGVVITDITKKMTAIDVSRSADFGGTVVSGMDRVDLSTRVSAWEEEITDKLDSMKAFEVF